MKMQKILSILLIFSLSSAKIKSEVNCGQIGDLKLKAANWPWIVSLFYYYDEQYFCTGTLISDKHVLSAAHCFSGFNFSTPHQQIFAIFGRTNFSQISPFEQIRNVSAVKTHPNWKKIDGNYDSDIALLTLADSVTFTDSVHRVCLPGAKSKNISVAGTIAGFKKSQNVEFFESPVGNVTSCLLGDEKSCEIYSDDFFCRSVSGSGFYGHENGKFRIDGIFSKEIDGNEHEFCGLNNFIVFTIVADYVEWIIEAISLPFLGLEREGKELKTTVEIFCDYRWNYEQSNPVYTCIIRGLIVPSPYLSTADSIQGLHGDDDSDSDVTRVHITKSKTIYLPDLSQLSKKFPNLENFWVSKSNLKFIERQKLQPLSNLTVLCLNENQIEDIPDDAFDDLEKLEVLWLYSNRITKLGDKLFKNLKKLQVFDARNNLIQFLPGHLFSNNSDLKVVNFSFNLLKNIEVRFTELKSLKWIVLDGNKCIKASYCKSFDCLKSTKQLQDVVDRDC